MCINTFYLIRFLFGERKGSIILISLYCVLMPYVCFFLIRRKQPSPEPMPRREAGAKPETLTNGKWSGPSHASQHLNFGMPSPESPGFDDMEEENQTDALDRRYAIIFCLQIC